MMATLSGITRSQNFAIRSNRFTETGDQDDFLQIVNVSLWSLLKVEGQTPCSYKSSSGTEITRWPPRRTTRIQFESASVASYTCSRQWLEKRKSNDSLSTLASFCASPCGES